MYTVNLIFTPDFPRNIFKLFLVVVGGKGEIFKSFIYHFKMLKTRKMSFPKVGPRPSEISSKLPGN